MQDMTKVGEDHLRRGRKVGILEPEAKRVRVLEVKSVSRAKGLVKFADGSGHEFSLPIQSLDIYKVDSSAPLSKPRGEAKRYIVEEIVRKNLAAETPKARKEIIDEIMEKADMTKSGASTYYFNAVNKYKKMN